MTQKTVLITGASGLLGRGIFHAFARAGWRTVGTGLTRTAPPRIIKLDILDADAVGAALEQTQPAIVIHAAADRRPDSVDASPAAARALNVTATAALAAACAARGVALLYISTDYVFGGAPGEAPYEASSTPAPTNLYGRTKLDGEKEVLDRGGWVLRVPVLYGPVEEEAESAVNVLGGVVRAGKGKVDDWAVRYPTHTEDVGRVCAEVAGKVVEGESGEEGRVLQFSSEDALTKFQICEVIARAWGVAVDGLERDKKGNDPDASVQRPYDTHLSTRRLKEMGVDVSTRSFEGFWREQVGK